MRTLKNKSRSAYMKAWRRAHPTYAHEWALANPEKIKEKRRRYAKAHPERVAANKRRWALANPDKIRVTKHNWYVANAKKSLKRSFRWLATHPEECLVYGHKRRARERANGGTFTVAEWRAVKKCFGYRCPMCGKKKLLTADHIVPLSKGGSNSIENIQPLCKSCNSKKHDRVMRFSPWVVKK